ncbi:hypothetical protein OAO18_06570 [Francisellaceae bacterium]|nr:hypothetical protein [Francisellaceae bacterium]
MTKQNINGFLQELKELISSESVPCIGGKSDLPVQVGLQVKGRHISLPVNGHDLEWLCEEGNTSPFGKGMDTVIDKEVRKSIEFESNHIEILNPKWNAALSQLVDQVRIDMGINFQVEAELFKLLVYREGGHFKYHQDTEKSDRMFGTLIAQLPSRCTGGSLKCLFADEEYQFDFGNNTGDSEFCIYYAAHYADVQHQVEKITNGSRLALIYNLIQPEKRRKLSASHHKFLLDSAKNQLIPALNSLSSERHSILLNHEYTEKSLSDMGFLACKGKDRDLIESLIAINDNLPLEQKLYFLIGRVSYQVTSDGVGYGEYSTDWEEIETTEPECDILYDETGQRITSSNFHIDWAHEIRKKKVVSTFFEDAGDDFWGSGSDEIEGFMGNYGPTKETTYSRYLVALAPLYSSENSEYSKDLGIQSYTLLLMARDIKQHHDCGWLKDKFNELLNKVTDDFNTNFCQKDAINHWNDEYRKNGNGTLHKLVTLAIEVNDVELCNNLLNMACERLVAGLESGYQYDDAIKILTLSINHFDWDNISESCEKILSKLTGATAVRVSQELAENQSANIDRSALLDICVKAVCQQKNSWGGGCSFLSTILPLARNTCDSKWSASDGTKKLFLDTSLNKGAKHPSFVSAIVRNLMNYSDLLDDKDWLLQPLASMRLEQLEVELCDDVKDFSWEMPDAKCTNSAITTFLRSDESQINITGYNGIAMARKDIIKIKRDSILPELYIESKADFVKNSSNHSFSANMEAKGRGKAAYLEVVKDRRYYDACLKLRKLREKEYKTLLSKYG